MPLILAHFCEKGALLVITLHHKHKVGLALVHCDRACSCLILGSGVECVCVCVCCREWGGEIKGRKVSFTGFSCNLVLEL